MKIFLAEERSDQQQRAHGFDRTVIKIGRDKNECQVIFDDTKWPMVSRKHAELRLENSRYILVDLGSTLGTYVDGQPITQPTEVGPGARLQFGMKGPILVVASIERGAQESGGLSEPPPEPDIEEPAPSPVTPPVANQPNPDAPVAQMEPPPQPVTPPPLPQPPATVNIPSVELIDNTGRLRRFQINKDVTCLGRDQGVEIQIDADAAIVSRRHAEIRRENDYFMLIDLNSFNGTFHNHRRITAPTPLRDGDQIQLGIDGVVCLFRDPAHPALQLPSGHLPGVNSSPGGAEIGLPTITAVSGTSSPTQQEPTSNLELIQEHSFTQKSILTVGRAIGNDITLSGLQISNYHARISHLGTDVYIEDIRSTNGVYVNGARIATKTLIKTQDVVQIGPFQINVDALPKIFVFDTRFKTRIDVKSIIKCVRNRTGAGTIRLLDDVDLSIQPNEFVGLLGPSGAGKSTLMDALNGMRPATSGQVLINNLDLYDHIDALKQSIGYVPQDDILHRKLTVYRTLYFVARLRLSQDVSEEEIDQIVGEVMDLTGLSERRDVLVDQLSGGQRKRVSIAVELITKPSVIFLDEPTSGLDPGAEEKIMKLFRQIAENGRTVILTTHAMENVKLFDKLVVLMRGKLVFYGTPREALAHVKATSFKDLYDKLEAPGKEQIKKLVALPADATPEQLHDRKFQMEKIGEAVAEDWKLKFLQTEIYKRYIQQPLEKFPSSSESSDPPARRHPGVRGSLRQWRTLTRRYFEVLCRDRLNLLILFGQAPLVAVLTYLVVGNREPRDFPYFILALVAIWFGTSIAAREIIRERAVYDRERMVNLGILPYIGSKVAVLSLIVGLQCVLLFGSLKLLRFAGFEMPGKYYGIAQLGVMILTAMVGIAFGLLISAVVSTSEMATSLVPLILIPQILFCGLVGVPRGISKMVGLAMPATWSFDEMKRLSSLKVLRGQDEHAQPSSVNEGRGLYKQLGHRNKQNIADAQNKITSYRSDAEKSIEEFQKALEQYQIDIQRYRAGQIQNEPVKPPVPRLNQPPKISDAEEVPEDLSDYLDFLHPWGGVWWNPAVLFLMFTLLVGACILTLRSQDIR